MHSLFRAAALRMNVLTTYRTQRRRQVMHVDPIRSTMTKVDETLVVSSQTHTPHPLASPRQKSWQYPFHLPEGIQVSLAKDLFVSHIPRTIPKLLPQ